MVRVVLPGSGRSACTKLSQKKWMGDVLGEAELLTRHAQRLFAGGHAPAPEFSKADIAAVFRANGTHPGTANYNTRAANGFTDGQIAVTGLVAHPLSLSMAAPKTLRSRTQITRHFRLMNEHCQWHRAHRCGSGQSLYGVTKCLNTSIRSRLFRS